MGSKDPTKTVEHWEKEENLKLITMWSEKGLISDEVAHNMGIVKSTFYKMMKESPKVTDAYYRGKMKADMKVMNAYYQLALGHSTNEVTKVRDPDTGEMVIEKIVVKDVPPNERAASTWIKNRAPEFMKDNQLTETYKAKLEAETALIKAKVSLLQGDSKDTSHLNALISLFDGMKEKE